MTRLLLLLALAGCCPHPVLTTSAVELRPGYAPAYPPHDVAPVSERVLADHALCREMPR